MSHERAQTVLHIGGQKCGSSALQGYLFFGRFSLARRGIFYLDEDLGTDLQAAKSHSLLRPKLKKGGADWVRRRAERLDWDNPDHTYVLSSEGFCEVENAETYAAALAPLAEFGPVRLIFYVRPQVEVLYSGWQQWGVHLNFREWVRDALRRDFANWNRIWQVWRGAFPEAQFTTRLFARDNFPDGDMVADVRGVLGWPEVTLPVCKPANPTFDDLTVLAIQALAQKNSIDPKPLTIAMKRAGVNLPRSRDNLVLDVGLKAEIMAHYAKDNLTFLAASDMDPEEIECFGQDRLPDCRARVSPEAIAAKAREVVECLNATPTLSKYVGLQLI